MAIQHHPKEGDPRPCPFCHKPAGKRRSFYTMFSKFVYFCENKECRLGKSDVKFWFEEWQGIVKPNRGGKD